MLRTGAQIWSILMKINRRNFEAVSSESEIFEDTNIIQTSKKSNFLVIWNEKNEFWGCHAREYDFRKSECDQFGIDPPTKSSLKARPCIFWSNIDKQTAIFWGCLERERDF